MAVYTRGSARLEDGRAVVELDPTFEWVANPDLGLTLADSVRGRLKESLTTTERLTGEDVADKLGLRW